LTSKVEELQNTDSSRQEFFVHQELLEELCHPLCDELREYWKVFDSETVGRLAQYLYQADYGYPVPTPVRTTATTTSTLSDEFKSLLVPVTTGDSNPLSQSSLKSGVDATLEVNANTLVWGTSNDHAELLKESARQTSTPARSLTPLGSLKIPKFDTFSKRVFPEWPKKPAGHGYEAVLLAHAKLYILSYGLGICAMPDFCIARLHRELTEISPPPIDQRILGNVVKLLRYAYCHPRDVTTAQPLQPV
jgi:hypothetical protein